VKQVFTHENRLIVYNIKNLLEEQGIECVIKNEFAGGGVGDLAPFETWPELWVTEPKQYGQAEQIIQQTREIISGKPWVCPSCGESNESNFELCWSCGSFRDNEPAREFHST